MNQLRTIRYPMVIRYCTTVHFIVALMLLLDSSARNITAIRDLSLMFGSGLALVLFIVAVLAIVPTFRPFSWLWGTLCMVPQQLILMMSAGSAIAAMVASAYADGVVRPRAFIIADQCPIVLVTVFHTLAVTRGYWETQDGK